MRLPYVDHQRIRSVPAEPLYVTSDKWGSLNGTLLNLSYGYGRIYTVPYEKPTIEFKVECVPFLSLICRLEIIRGRFSPYDGQLYVGGMFAWASSRQDQEGGLYRVRHLQNRFTCRWDGSVLTRPMEKASIEISWSDPLDAKSLGRLQDQVVTVWGLKRSANYGSDHVNEHH